MYDGGNQLTIKTSAGSAAYLAYTNTNSYTSAGIGDVQYYTYKQTGTVTAFVAEFTSASSAITGFQITGNNGADGGGSKAYGKHDSSTWTGLQNGWSSAFKQVYSAGDPSINHLVVADGPIASQSIGSSTDNDLHDLTFSSGVSKVVYVLWAGDSGYEFSGAYFQSVAEALSSACSQGQPFEVTSDVTLDTDATPGGFTFHSLVIQAGATLKAVGSNPLIINADHEVNILGTIDLSGGKGGNSAGDHKAAGGGAGGGALKISAPTIAIGPAGAIHADGGDGGDSGGPGQAFFPQPWSTGAGDGAGGVGVAGGGAGGAGGGTSSSGQAGSGPGASAGGPYYGGVPPGAGGAGHAFAGTAGFGQYEGVRPAGGVAYGDPQLSGGLQGGSGAGGGGNDGDNEEGAGGGGSGGMIYLVAATLHIEGTITAEGGLGGRDDYHYNNGMNRECCNNGGPGSVGRIRLDSGASTVSGTVTPAAYTPPFAFQASQTIDGETVTCSSTTTTATYTQCSSLTRNGYLGFQNGVTCGPMWQTTNPQGSDLIDFCQTLLGFPNPAPAHEFYYACGSGATRSTWNAGVWGTANDNGYLADIRCYYP